MLFTGRSPLYMSAHVVRDRGIDAEVSSEPLWSPVEKVAAEELGPYLAGRQSQA
jgi:hypothetical protein